MEEDKYQISKKADYINLLLLEDELTYFDGLLSQVIDDKSAWLAKLRATREVFLTLNNVKDSASRMQIEGGQDFVNKTRILRKNLFFANHFRNRGIGHLNDTLLKRAAQWHPQIFFESAKDQELMRTIESHRAIIETCINSFVDGDGNQKVFGHEIDLMYPPDAEEFYNDLHVTVSKAISWVSEAKDILYGAIDLHSDDEIKEVSSIAGATNFNLKEDSSFEFSEEEMKENFTHVLKVMEDQGVDEKVQIMLRKMAGI